MNAGISLIARGIAARNDDTVSRSPSGPLIITNCPRRARRPFQDRKFLSVSYRFRDDYSARDRETRGILPRISRPARATNRLMHDFRPRSAVRTIFRVYGRGAGFGRSETPSSRRLARISRISFARATISYIPLPIMMNNRLSWRKWKFSRNRYRVTDRASASALRPRANSIARVTRVNG